MVLFFVLFLILFDYNFHSFFYVSYRILTTFDYYELCYNDQHRNCGVPPNPQSALAPPGNFSGGRPAAIVPVVLNKRRL